MSTSTGLSIHVRPGDTLYIPTRWSIEHGSDDICGGIAVVKEVTNEKSWGHPPYDLVVTFENICRTFYLRPLLEDQDKLRIEYGEQVAHNCPDIDVST